VPEPILYQRGPYQLRRDARRDGTLRSPFLQIFWYSHERKREVSASTGTDDEREGRKALDRHYLTRHEGEHFCPTCGQPVPEHILVTDAIADYLALKDDKTISARLGHVVDYITADPTQEVRCDRVDERWVEGFRIWCAKQPVVHTSGAVREDPRAPSTIENSVIHLAASIRAKRLEPHFKPIATKELNRTPKRRLTVKEMAEAFRYATAKVDAKGRKVGRDRANLHRFLIATVATLARPDAAHDISTDRKRDQWHSNSRILDLNPKGRRPTKKRRAIVRVPYQFARHLDWLYVPGTSSPSAPESEGLSSASCPRPPRPRRGWPRHLLRGEGSIAAAASLVASMEAGGFIRLLSGLTCSPSTLDRGVASFISSLRETPARTTASPESAPEPMASGSLPPRSSASPTSAGLILSSARTCRGTPADSLRPSSRHWSDGLPRCGRNIQLGRNRKYHAARATVHHGRAPTLAWRCDGRPGPSGSTASSRGLRPHMLGADRGRRPRATGCGTSTTRRRRAGNGPARGARSGQATQRRPDRSESANATIARARNRRLPPAVIPGPTDSRWIDVLDRWPELQPALSQEEAESHLRRGIDAMAHRVERLRATGNGVDPVVAAYAFLRLDALLAERYYANLGYRVRAGGPAMFRMAFAMADVAEVDGRGDLPDAVIRHNPMATTASRGCTVTGCAACIVPAMEGSEFTFLPDFTPRPILTDNNLSALPVDYQEHSIARYQAAGVPLLDANSGFEPKTFDEDVFMRWRRINKGAWRFGLDDTFETADAERAIAMLKRHGVGARKIRVYVMIGHEPFAECMKRIRCVIDMGAEPYVQPVMKLNAREKRPWVRHDWTPKLLGQVQRWANSPMIWRKASFDEYDSSIRTNPRRQPGDLL
jgi:hypothetical protein